MIHVRSIETLGGDGDSRQELDRDFLHTGYRRRLMVSTEPGFAWRGRPTRSRQPLTLVPIPLGGGAACTLRWLDHDGAVRTVPLAAGRYYHVPAETPYQIEARGAGALEVFNPAPADGRLFDEETLPDDFFAARGEGA